VRAICYVRPAILKSERKIDWKTVIEAGEWSVLLSRIIDKYVLTFGFDSIQKGVLAMRENLGLKVDVADELLERIDEGELLRNVIIHDGGRASSEYLKRSQRTDVTLGEQLPIEPVFVQAVSGDLLMLGGVVLLAVSEAHFGRKRESITGVWTPGPK
jgi:hypothetical protein